MGRDVHSPHFDGFSRLLLWCCISMYFFDYRVLCCDISRYYGHVLKLDGLSELHKLNKMYMCKVILQKGLGGMWVDRGQRENSKNEKR